MRTLEIDIKDEDIVKYGIKSNAILLDELVSRIKNEMSKDAIRACQEAVKDTSCGMTIEEINQEIAAYRNEKHNN